MLVSNALEWAKKELIDVSGDDAAIDARELVALAIGHRPNVADMLETLTEDQQKTLEEAVKRRKTHEPLQYVLGEWDFMGLTFFVSKDTLIPRQDTETLAEEAETLIKSRGYKSLLDICTGTGCIALSLEKRTGISATLSDISPAALDIARRNKEKLGSACRIVESDLFEAFGGDKFDLITANPPYISKKDMALLQEEVKKEPELALYGGDDGLDLYRRIAEEFFHHLTDGGTLIMEIGCDQGESVQRLFAPYGRTRLIKDICGLDRVVVVTPVNSEEKC